MRQTLTAIKDSADAMVATNKLKGSQENLAFLTTMTGVKHQCLIAHHLEEFGSTILNTQTGHYTLIIIGDNTHLVMVDTFVLFDMEDKSIPGLDYLKDLDMVARVDINLLTTGQRTIPRTEVALHSTI
eukprot:1214573-Ditylum_brightwellii.AAC.1